nr:hypothetical protein [Tanacetum cinerariifolium]
MIEGLGQLGLGYRVTWGVGEVVWYYSDGVRCTVGSAYMAGQESPYVTQIGRREMVVLFDGHGRMLADSGRKEVVVVFDGYGRMLADYGRREVVVVFDGHGRMLADSERKEVVVVFD